MSTLILGGHDIEPYLPTSFSDDAKEKVWRLAQEIERRVHENLIVPFRYYGEARLVQGASLYLQNATPNHSSNIHHPIKGYPWKMKVYKKGARKTIGMDALEIMKERKTPEWWKTFHLDKIDDLSLLSEDEIIGHFKKRIGREDIESYLHENRGDPEGFVKNWNHWFRIFLAQAKSEADLK